MFYKGETTQILISLLTISLAFSLPFFAQGTIAYGFAIVLLTMGSGFVLHELAHKAVAQRFGAVAYYKAWMEGLALAVIMAIATAGKFVFAAPGAVYIHKKNLTRREDGIISAAGSFTNILLAFFFLWLAAGTLAAKGVVSQIGAYGAVANSFLAFFNMVPIPPLDGSKVFQWNIIVWAAMFFGAAYLTFVVSLPLIHA